MECISVGLRIEFREICCTKLVLRQINDVFQGAGIQPSQIRRNSNINGERRSRIEEYYASIDWSNVVDVEKFLKVIELALSLSYFDENGKENIQNICTKEGLIVDEYRVKLLKPDNQDKKYNLFKRQFPAGLPFGKDKPHVRIFSDDGFQKIEYEMNNKTMIIQSKHEIYPNFSYKNLQAIYNLDAHTDESLRRFLLEIQTEKEAIFLKIMQKNLT
ncbi:hypothetical protein H6G45_10395 [Synechocystis sp. FACHB-383]|uniref:hypothetical protein n=1 Tax=Synechocystis sp. FACHB-383 TaxID=2692864 RepID=UPI00168952F9|nr:hypothetical protein [Synechocystis sp. FACHB-383]MBD2653890.1 hypothetical protein [Synechocystis sp. FACHB-383]